MCCVDRLNWHLNNGHLTKSLRNYFVNVRSPAEVAIPWLHLEVRNAATSDVPVVQSVLTLSARGIDPYSQKIKRPLSSNRVKKSASNE